MTGPAKNCDLIHTVTEKQEKKRLPLALSIKEQTDAGELLDEFDIEFMACRHSKTLIASGRVLAVDLTGYDLSNGGELLWSDN